MTRYSVACIGLGGYARNYADAVARLSHAGRVRIVALADIDFAPHGEAIAACAHDRPRQYTNYREMLERERPDVVTIGTGLHLHRPMLEAAVAAGSHVVLAKPAAVTVQDFDAMIEAANTHGRRVAVDFQHAISGSAQKVKELIASGALGTVREVLVKAIWRRGAAYYARNAWAGKQRMRGVYVLDGPMNNPHAHYLLNALYFGHPGRYAFAAPVEVQAELYRAKPIEGEDTACIRARTDTGAVIHAYLTLCGRQDAVSPEVIIRGDRGQAAWLWDRCTVSARDGTAAEYRFERATSFDAVAALLDTLDGGDPVLCSLEDARGHVLLTSGAYASGAEICEVLPPYRVTERVDGDETVFIDGIEPAINRAMAQRKLFSEIGVPWARKSASFVLSNYRDFNL